MGYSNEDLESIIKYFRSNHSSYVDMHSKYVTIRYCNEDFKFNFFFDGLKLDPETGAWRRREVPTGLKLGWKLVTADMKSRNGYRWRSGKWHVPEPSFKSLVDGMQTRTACPAYEGDGLCLAKTWDGAISGAASPYKDSRLLLVAYMPSAVLNEGDIEKLRVSSCYVIASTTLAEYVTWCNNSFRFKRVDGQRTYVHGSVSRALTSNQ